MKEEFRIIQYEGKDIMVSNTGRVFKINKYGFLEESTYNTDESGYVFASNIGVSGFTRVHRLVAFAFLPNPNNLPYINHKDENKSNNRVDNLEWCDATYNNNYGTIRERNIDAQVLNYKSYKKGGSTSEQCKKGWETRRKNNKKVTPIKLVDIKQIDIETGEIIATYSTIKDAINSTGFSYNYIRSSCRGMKKHYTKYAFTI